MPVCSKCGIQKTFDQFPVDKSRSTGRSPRCTTCSRVASKVYDATHKKQRKRYNKKHAEHNAAVGKAWREAHPEQNRVLHEQYRARVNEVEGEVTLEEWMEILEEHEFTCHYCKQVIDGLTMDHVIPISKGGRHEADNIVPACLSCNSSKGAKTLEEWKGNVGR